MSSFTPTVLHGEMVTQSASQDEFPSFIDFVRNEGLTVTEIEIEWIKTLQSERCNVPTDDIKAIMTVLFDKEGSGENYYDLVGRYVYEGIMVGHPDGDLIRDLLRVADRIHGKKFSSAVLSAHQ